MSTLRSNFKMPQIIAHRGASFDAPENTLSAVRLGWQQNADAVEIDIHLCRDGRIVVMHDGTTIRTTGVDGRIDEQDFESLRQLDAGGWKDDRFSGERIPELAEVVETLPTGEKLFIEIKCGPEIVAPLQQVLLASGLSLSQFVVMDFWHDTLLEVKKALPGVEAYWLVGAIAHQDEKTLLAEMAELVRRAGAADFQGLNLQYDNALYEPCVRLVQAAGLKCHAWTVDSAETALRLQENGIDGITTNRPGWLREQLRSG